MLVWSPTLALYRVCENSLTHTNVFDSWWWGGSSSQMLDKLSRDLCGSVQLSWIKVRHQRKVEWREAGLADTWRCCISVVIKTTDVYLSRTRSWLLNDWVTPQAQRVRECVLMDLLHVHVLVSGWKKPHWYISMSQVRWGARCECFVCQTTTNKPSEHTLTHCTPPLTSISLSPVH